MSERFEEAALQGMIVRGKLREALAYLKQFPETAALYRQGAALYGEEHYLTYDVDAELNEILLLYQKYYRDAFYLELPPEDAARRLRERLAEHFQAGPDASLDELEETAAEAFRRKSLYALMGRTEGYYGPYIWRTEELKHYAVELPEGTQDYAVKLLDGFVSRSWLDYISFGEIGAGGWSNGDGLIHCVRSAYDLASEDFRVSLLKHEAQHAADQAKYQGISVEDLEYRAKLVELIYSSQRPLLDHFLARAETTRASDGHGLAAARIAEGFRKRLGRSRGELSGLPVGEVQAVARALFLESTSEMEKKYH